MHLKIKTCLKFLNYTFGKTFNIWHICTYDTHVLLVHMYLWHICTYGAHVLMMHMYL